jgi:hypothetical protein
MAEGLAAVVGAPTDFHPHHVHRCTEILNGQTTALSNNRVAAIGADEKIGPDFKQAVGRFGARTNNSTVLLDEVRYLCLHNQAKTQISLGMLFDEIEEIPLGHEGEEFAMSGYMSEIRNGDSVRSDLSSKFAQLLVRTLKEFL